MNQHSTGLGFVMHPSSQRSGAPTSAEIRHRKDVERARPPNGTKADGPWFCHHALMSMDPVVTNPEHYRIVFENDRVRVLEYTDQPGDVTTPHQHPDSVMYTLSSFRRRLVSGDVGREVELEAGAANWLPAQIHHGENIGDTATHVIFVELKGAGAGIDASAEAGPGALGPQPS